MSTTILGTTIQQSFCEYIYYPPFFPHFGKESAFSLITICLEFLILLFLLSCILRKKWYQCRGLENEARSLLLPFYDRVLYYYALVTLLRILFYLSQFVYEVTTASNTRDISYSQPFWIIIGDAAGEIGIIGLEVFILFLLMQTSAGTKAYKRAYRATILVCCICICIMLFKHFYPSSHYLSFCIGEIAEESVLFVIFIGVTIYCYFYQVVRHRKRQRNKILYGYIVCLLLLNMLLLTAYILLIFAIDGYCLDILSQYIFRLLFPWIAFITIRSDSEFWRMLLLSWQTSSSKAGEIDADDDDNLLARIKSIFGMQNAHKPSFNSPLMDALSLGVKMVDFTELREKSDPFAMGSTATVSTAKLAGEIVAVKVFIFDELSMETVAEFFRESLLISNLHHQNIVEFKGACLRPPELCLVYEYCCCGDLTHLILTQFFHPQSLRQQNKENASQKKEDPKLFRYRIKMLLDVSRGMTRLHDSGIIHRDLKTSNVLVDYQMNKGYCAKVCDFGSARKILSHSDHHRGARKKEEYVPPKRRSGKSLDSLHKNKEKKVKKHRVVIEEKEKGEKGKEHKRAHTVTLSKGIFNKKLFKLKKKKKCEELAQKKSSYSSEKYTGSKKSTLDIDRMRVLSNSTTHNKKTSINYFDIDEEEKDDKPHYMTDKQGESSAKNLDVDDNGTETESVITTMNYDGAQIVNNARDPTQLAFSVSPILLTTQVGTLAFMAPEMLSHVNIGALSGGWQNKEKEKEKAENVKISEWKEEEEESEESEEKNLDTVVIKIESRETQQQQDEVAMIDIKITKKQKLFTREYINKHRELTTKKQHDIAITAAPPQKSLPPTPPQRKQRNMSIVSQGIRRMFTSSYTNAPNLSWQNRDIFAYNSYNSQPAQLLAPGAAARDFYSIPLKNKPIARNVENYALRELPPDPPRPQRRNNHKSKYFSRGRSPSKLSVRSMHGRKSIKSQLSVMDAAAVDDDARSMIYETQQFEIVYEVSDNALYDDSVDVYSFAVIMWEVALCDRIYNEMDMKMIRDMVCEGDRMPTPTYRQCKSRKYKKKQKYGLSNVKENVYLPLIELINQCWAQSPVDRPKFYEIQKRLQVINKMHLLQNTS